MSRTALRLDLPAGSWLGDVSRSVPSATLRVDETVSVSGGDPSEALVDEPNGIGNDPGETDINASTVATVRVAGTDRGRVEDALRGHERVARETAVDRRGDVRTFRILGRAPAYLPAARAVGLPIESTVEVVDGRASVTVVGDRDRIEAFGRRLADDGVTVGVAATGGDDPDRTLTEAQRELVFEAVRSGYYDTPRRCTLTELAEANGIAKSTCSETLHRAEGRVMQRFVDSTGPFDSTSETADAVAGGRSPGGVSSEAGEVDTDDPGELDVDDPDEFDAGGPNREEPVRSAATEP